MALAAGVANVYTLRAKSIPLSRQNGAGLVAHIEETAAQLGMDLPATRLVKTKSCNAYYHAASHTFFVTDGILNLMGNSSPMQQPTREVKAILGHEFGHAKFGARQTIPTIGIALAVQFSGLFAMYLLEQTHERRKKRTAAQETEQPDFWKDFNDVFRESKADKGKSFYNLMSYSYPVIAKVLGADYYKDKTWTKAVLDQGKIIAANAMLLLPAAHAVQPLAMRNEWECDRFMLAHTKDKEGCLSAFKKLADHTHQAMMNKPRTALEKNLLKRFKKSYDNYIYTHMGAHPPLYDRIDHIRNADIAQLSASYGL